MKENYNSGLSFSCSQVEGDEIMKEINELKTKATQNTAIPQNLLRKIVIFLEILFLEIIIAFPILFFQTPSKMQS